MTPASIHLAGERLLLDPTGALYWPAERLLAVADLHLEKGSAFARHGNLLPPWDTQATLDRLVLLLRRWNPVVVTAVGDSFHDNDGVARLPASQLARLRAISTERRVVWLRGNHDPDPPDGIGGEIYEHFSLGRLLFRHQACSRFSRSPGQEGGAEISGHYHPKATVPTRGGPLSRPCFVTDGRRLVLPAFGAYTGGLDVGESAIARLFPRGGRVFLLGRSRLFSFALGAATTGTRETIQLRPGTTISRV